MVPYMFILGMPQCMKLICKCTLGCLIQAGGGLNIRGGRNISQYVISGGVLISGGGSEHVSTEHVSIYNYIIYINIYIYFMLDMLDILC